MPKLAHDGHYLFADGRIIDHDGDGGYIDRTQPIVFDGQYTTVKLLSGESTTLWPEHALLIAVMFNMKIRSSQGRIYEIEEV